MNNDGRARHVAVAGVLLATLCAPVNSPAQNDMPRTQDGYPDLNGNWSGRVPRGSTNVPRYKPEHAARVRELGGRREIEDPTYDCGQFGFPRAGPPQKLIQSPGEIVFLYATASGMAWRIVPTDGRPLPEYNDPTFYGDAVAHWEGDTLVIESTNFDVSMWLGARGDDGSNPPGPGDAYFHSGEMSAVERIRYEGENLLYEVSVTDPVVLAEPWVMDPITLRRMDEPPLEPPKCVAISPEEYGFGG